ncbi:MAG: hypothetical protein ABI194_04940 [Gemmatimonadaceae bacterium]
MIVALKDNTFHLVGLAIVVIVAVLMRRRKGSSGMDESLDGPSRSRGMTVVLLVAALILTMLISMTIRVDNNTVSWSVGPGLIRGSVALTDIADTRLVTTGTGWGLRHSESDGCTTYRGHTPSSSTAAMAKTFAWVATNLPNWLARSAPTSGV